MERKIAKIQIQIYRRRNVRRTRYEFIKWIFDQFDQTALFSFGLGSKFSLQTNLYWQKKIGGSLFDFGRGLVVDGSGNVYVNGSQQSDSYDGNDYE